MIEGVTGAFSTGLTHPGEKHAGNDPSRIEDAAKQFESLLLAFMLKSMREAGSAGWLGTGEDQTASSAMELAEEHFAAALAAQGGLGLASLVASGLKDSD